MWPIWIEQRREVTIRFASRSRSNSRGSLLLAWGHDLRGATFEIEPFALVDFPFRSRCLFSFFLSLLSFLSLGVSSAVTFAMQVPLWNNVAVIDQSWQLAFYRVTCSEPAIPRYFERLLVRKVVPDEKCQVSGQRSILLSIFTATELRRLRSPAFRKTRDCFDTEREKNH